MDNKKMAIEEHMVKASQSLDFACADLRAALRAATALESLLLLDVIEAVAKAQRRVESIRMAAHDSAADDPVVSSVKPGVSRMLMDTL